MSNFENFKIIFNSPFFYNSQITFIKNKKTINIFQGKKIKSKLIIDSKDDFLNFNYQK